MKNTKTTILAVFMIGLALLAASCTTNVVDPSALPAINKLKIADAIDGDTHIEVYADEALHAGYNNIYVRAICKCDGSVLTDAHVELLAQMRMSSGIHSAPAIQPTSSTPNAQGLFTCGVVCTMPSGTLGDWTLEFSVHNHRTDTEHEFAFATTVNESSTVQAIRANDGTEYFCVMDFASGMHTGINDVRYWVYQHNTETTILAMPTMELSTKVTMTEMGHGSSGNTQPVAAGDGCYTSKVNLSMSGNWAIELSLKSNGSAIGTATFKLHV